VDPEHFDAFARALDTTRSRRGALIAILAAIGAVPLASDLARAGKRGRKRRPKRPRGRGSRCIDCADRPLTRGADLKGCDLSGRDLSGADLRSADLAGACLQNADLTGAELRSADLEGADVRGANFTDANLDRADIRAWRSDDAIFCRTTMPDGEVYSANCLPGSGATCLGLNESCGLFGGTPCCHYGQPGRTRCDSSTGILTGFCQSLCRSNADCQNLVNSTNVYYANDPLSDFGCASRHFDRDLHCCARKTCEHPQDCQGGLCCHPSPAFPGQCCLKDERCLATFGCAR
jgi:hypothetical protein